MTPAKEKNQSIKTDPKLIDSTVNKERKVKQLWNCILYVQKVK